MKPHDLNFYRPRRIITRARVACFVVAVFAILGFWNWSVSNYSRELSITNDTNGNFFRIVSKPSWSMLGKIQEGVSLLEGSPPLEYNSVRKQIALAMLDQKTGEVFEHRIWVSEEEIQNYKKTGIINLVSAADNSRRDLSVVAKWWNSFNTYYEVSGHPELIIIANKYPFPSNYLNDLPEKSKNKYTDIVYVPYSQKLHTPELVEAGKHYLERNIDQAFDELDSNKVSSLLVAGEPITAEIDKDLIRNIILVEHIDPDVFNSADDGGQELSERVLVIIGANQDRAYRYTGSSAGASGLAQFIKPTYDLMVARYPKAQLLQNYNAGMADHKNAIKAMVLFFDNHKKDITGKITRRDIVQSLGITEEMLAATYNGGPSRVARSVNQFGLAWFSGQLRLPDASQILRKETLNYVKKFEAVKNLHLFANIYPD